jgi:hypothetical protein
MLTFTLWSLQIKMTGLKMENDKRFYKRDVIRMDAFLPVQIEFISVYKTVIVFVHDRKMLLGVFYKFIF